MKIRIFQINTDRDALHLKFSGLREAQKTQKSYGLSAMTDSSIYDEVYSGEVDCKTLEDIFTMFNTNHPPFFRGHSLSVSDVIEITDNSNNYLRGCFYCDSFGFELIQFHAGQTQKPDNLLRVVALEPCKPAYEAEVTDHFRAFQQAVRGHFEVAYPFEDDAVLVCNEEGLIRGMEPNCIINGNVYVGPMFIVKNGGDGSLYSLTDEQIEKYLAAFQSQEIDEDMDSGMQMH